MDVEAGPTFEVHRRPLLLDTLCEQRGEHAGAAFTSLLDHVMAKGIRADGPAAREMVNDVLDVLDVLLPCHASHVLDLPDCPDHTQQDHQQQWSALHHATVPL